jgi:asparaginyl-tRNA synthetase
MFRVTTLDMENLPKTEDGKVDYSQDFFGKESHLTVSGQLDVETYAHAFRNVYTLTSPGTLRNSSFSGVGKLLRER